MLKKEAVHERREFNKELYNRIFRITKKPKTILDLGCGLNPVYFPHRDIEYLALDKDKGALKKVKRHFKKNKIKSRAFHLDLNYPYKLKSIKKVNLTFIFKVLDKFPKKTIKEILNNTKTDYFIISFSTRTITGSRMKKPKRRWFEDLISGLESTKIRFHNEIFYIIKK